MAQYILQVNSKVAPRHTTATIPPEHLRNDVIQRKIRHFDDAIQQKLGDSMNKSKTKSSWTEWIPYDNDDKAELWFILENSIPLNNFNISLTDALINAEDLLH